MIRLVPEAATHEATLGGAMVVILVGASCFTFGFLSRKVSPASGAFMMVVGAVAMLVGAISAWTITA